MSLDPAFREKQRNDFSGIVVTKRLKNGLIYVLEAKQLKVGPDKLIEEVFRLVNTYKPRKLIVETVQAQLLLGPLFRNKMRETGVFFTIEEAKSSSTEKEARIRGLIPYYANGQILHAPNLSDLEGQLLEFPRGIHDDIIDSFAYQQYDWKAPSAQKATKPAEKTGTWNWWSKRPQMGKKVDGQMKNLFGDLLNGH